MRRVSRHLPWLARQNAPSAQWDRSAPCMHYKSPYERQTAQTFQWDHGYHDACNATSTGGRGWDNHPTAGNYYYWLSMVHTGPNEHSVRTMKNWFALIRTHSVRTQWFHSVAMRTMEMPGSCNLKHSFGYGGRNLCCTSSVYYVAAEFCYKYGM